MSRATIDTYLAGKSQPTLPKILAMSHVLGVRAEWLAFGSGGMRAHDGGSEGLQDGGDLVRIPQLKVEGLEAGLAPSPLDLQHEHETLGVSRKWLDIRGLSAKETSFVMMRGRSMEPEFENGDLLLIDERVDYGADGYIHAVKHGKAFFIRRWKAIGKETAELIAANKEYPPIPIGREVKNMPDFEVLGMVVWRGSWVGG